MVAFTLAAGVSRKDPRAARAEQITRNHPQHIAEIDGWVCGWDRSGRPDAADFVVISRFDSAERYEAFRVHEDHARGKEAWAPIASWSVVDIVDDEVRAR